jgi:uncharacterized OB-fold protein
MAGQIPIAEGLFTTSATPQLAASRCVKCGELCFPRQASCPACTVEACEETLLSPRGVLWTWTIQRFPPTAPPYIGPTDRDAYVPFGVGYVELPEGIRVEARLTENDPDKLAIGMEMELVLEPFGIDGDGNERVTFAFRPVAPRGASDPEREESR